MDADTPLHMQAYGTICGYLDDFLPGKYAAAPESTSVSYMHGSACVKISVFEFGDGGAYVLMRAQVVSGLRMNEDLALHLLRQNARLAYGAFGLDEDGNLILSYALPGHGLTKDHFTACLSAVQEVADAYDDAIAEQHGGRTAWEMIVERMPGFG